MDKRRRTAVNSKFANKSPEEVQMDHLSDPTVGEDHRGSARLSTRIAMEEAQKQKDYEDEPDYDTDMAELLNQLPSRQIDGIAEAVSRTLRARRRSRRGGTMRHGSFEIEEQIIQSLHRDVDQTDDLELDDIDATLREVPTTLSRKRNIIRSLSRRQHKPVSKWKHMKYKCGMSWQHFKHEVRKLSRLFDLWRSHLMAIEGQFGTSVLSYFIFLKWVLLINIPVFLLTFSFLVIPQILYRYYQKDPPGYEDHAEEFTGIALLTGEGYFENTEMYYGFYTNETVEIISDTEYKMKYAYIFTLGGYYLMCLFILGYSYLHSYRKYYIEASGNISLYYFNLILSGWDFGIRSQETAVLKQKSIYNEFKEYLSGVIQEQNPASRDELAKKWLFRCLAWIVVVLLLGASGYATYVVSMELSLKPQLENSTVSLPELSPIAMPVVISCIQLFIPMIFTLLEAHEDFDRPKYELYVHMFRDMALKATMMGVLVFFWFTKAAPQVKCWETFVGQEIYRLVIVDFIFTLGYSFFMEFIRKLLACKWEYIERPEFAVGRHTLELVYSQSLCWIGVFYSPLLPVVVIIKMIIIFYVKRISVTMNCKPSLKPWRASRTHTIFVGYLFLFFILVFIAVGCSIILIKPSSACGPYQKYDAPYDVVRNLINDMKAENDVWAEIFGLINSPGFAFGVLLFLCMVTYYTRTIMRSHRNIVQQFKFQLASEGKDKRFLMNLLNQVKLRGRRVSRKAPQLRTLADRTAGTSKEDTISDNGHVFVKTVAASASPM